MGIIKQQLSVRGYELAERFCQLNSLPMPEVVDTPSDMWRVSSCAYYRAGTIKICLPKCASPGYVGRSWSWPGYVIDRTPYGVIAHELGHHVDMLRGSNRQAYWSDFSDKMRMTSGEPAITGYAPNTAEWFAEIFRLFLTNPDLLRRVRPLAARELEYLFRPAEERSWQEVLADAPERTILMARRKMIPEQGRLL